VGSGDTVDRLHEGGGRGREVLQADDEDGHGKLGEVVGHDRDAVRRERHLGRGHEELRGLDEACKYEVGIEGRADERAGDLGGLGRVEEHGPDREQEAHDLDLRVGYIALSVHDEGWACDVEELDEVRPVGRIPLGDEEDVEPAAGLDGVCVGQQGLDVVRDIRGCHRFKRLRDEGELEHESALLEEGG
jgi:hypothetical protein